jgi:hypothetical protein
VKRLIEILSAAGLGAGEKVPESRLKHPMYVLSKMGLVGTGRPRKIAAHGGEAHKKSK